MSTHIGTVTGLKERRMERAWETDVYTPIYDEIDLSVGRFYGGVSRGRCVQLTLSNGHHIQLTSDQVDNLRDMLKTSQW